MALFPLGEYLLVIIDAYSRFPEVEIVTSTSSQAVIPKMEQLFATHGIPKIIKSGPPFSSRNIKEFLHKYSSVHQHIMPLWPEANSQAENQNWRKELHKFLLNNWGTPHSTTGFAPAKLLFNCDINTKLPTIVRENKSIIHTEFVKRDAEAKERMKSNADNRHAKASTINVADTVPVKHTKKINSQRNLIANHTL